MSAAHVCVTFAQEDPKTEARADFGGDTSHVMTTEKYRSFHCQPLDNAVRSLRSMWSLASDHKSSAFAHLYEKSDEDILSSLSYSTKTLFNQVWDNIIVFFAVCCNVNVNANTCLHLTLCV